MPGSGRNINGSVARVLACALLCLIAWCGQASAIPVYLDDINGEYPLGRHAWILEDRTGQLAIDEVMHNASTLDFRPSTQDVPSFGFNTAAYWLKIDIHHIANRDERWLLDVSYPPLQHVDVFWASHDPDTGNETRLHYLKGGAATLVAERPFRHRTHVFPIDLMRHESTTLYVRITGESSKTIPLTLWRPDTFTQSKMPEFYVLGAYMGVMLALMAYNLSVWMFVREPAYAAYVAFMLCMTVLFLSLCGVGQQYLWPWSTQLAIRMTPASIVITYVCGGLFSLLFLDGRKHSPRLTRLIQGLCALCLTEFVLSWFLNYHMIIIATLITASVGVIASLGLAVIPLRQGNANARYFMVAWAFLLASMMVSILRVAGILPTNLFTEYSIFAGSATEAILLSVALAARMRTLKQEKDSARQLALTSQKIALETVTNYTRKLENEFEQRNRELLAAQQEIIAKQKMAALGVMTAGVAHEINNPNNFISAGVQNAEASLHKLQQYLYALIDEDTDPEIRNSFDEHFERLREQHELIADGSHRINTIVSGLGNITQHDRADTNVIPVTEGLRETIQLLQAKYHDIDFILDLRFNPSIVCWPAELNQVYMNVLINAVQAIEQRHHDNPDAPRGRIEIASCEATIGDCEQVEIFITDNGCGMSNEVRASAFDPFFTTKDVGLGAGLGLSIARDTIDKHKGQISIDSMPGQGTTFTISLPLVP